MPKQKPQADARALVLDATDIAGVQKAIAKIMAAKTPEAFAAVFDLAVDPPKLSFPVGVPFIAMTALDRAHKKHPEIRDLVIERCVKAPLDKEVWKRPVMLLTKIAREDKRAALANDKLLAGLRHSLGWTIDNMPGESVFTVAEIRDHGALPNVIAAIRKCAPKDGHLLWQISKAMVKLDGAKAADLEKLKAARARLKDASYGSYIDKEIQKLQKRLG